MNIIARGALQVAKWAGFNAAEKNKTQKQADRSGTNPDSLAANRQRIQLSLEGENAVKNTPFGRNYVQKRRMYCSGQISWSPDTGDAALDEFVAARLHEEWQKMGVECSMYDAFSRVADVHLPVSGDAMLRWYRDENGLKLLEITSDRIGEPWGSQDETPDDGSYYRSGLYWQGPRVVGYKIYQRGEGNSYEKPERVDAAECIFFKDDIFGGSRGISIFSAALEDVNSRYQILKATKDTMLQQSKVAAIARNNSGAPSEFDYQTVAPTNVDTIDYVESFADGAVVKYQFNGDSYQVLKGEHPSDSFLKGLKYVDAQACLAVGMPYEFLFTAQDSGGAPSRLAIEIASREITRIRERVHRPRLDKIAYVTIMDLVNRKELPNNPNITRGAWQFGTLPTADAFRDAASDIKDVRFGFKTLGDVISANSGRTYPVVLRRTMQEAIAKHKAVQDANRALEEAGYEATITLEDIGALFDNPQSQPTSLTESDSSLDSPSQVK